MTSERPTPSDASAACPEAAGGATAVEAAPLPAIDVDIFCPRCAYNLRSLTGIRCPECGTNIEAFRERGSVIPWVYRDKIGRIRAFWKTVWLVTFNDRRFEMEVGRPVDDGHARKFRFGVIIHAYLPLLAATLLAFALEVLTRDTQVYVVAGAALALVFAFLTAVTLLPYWAFRYRGLPLEAQRRTAVLLSYATAPLAWMVLAGLLAGLGVLNAATHVEEVAKCVYILAGLVAAVSILGVIYEAHRITRLAMTSRGSPWRFTWKLILSNLIVALTLFVAVPWGLIVLGVVYYSLK
jgi:hypothetical protein